MKDLSVIDSILKRASQLETKLCRTCWQVKTVSEFYIRRKGGIGNTPKCKSCEAKAGTDWYNRLPLSRQSELKIKYKKASYLRRHAGRITAAEAEKLARDRSGVCEICRQKTDVIIDHCHATGKRRGFLCPRCNMVLGRMHDDIQILCRAAEYLYKYQFRK